MINQGPQQLYATTSRPRTQNQPTAEYGISQQQLQLNQGAGFSDPNLNAVYRQFGGQDDKLPRGNLQSDCIKIYVTLKKDSESDGDYRKLILMTQSNQKVSMLKRLVEQEFSDLFPNEPTFICAKLQDQYGYSLSNSSYIFELIQNGDRLFALPERIGSDMGSANLHLTSDIQELLYLLRSMQQNICAKLTDAQFQNVENLEEVLAAILPLGFSASSKMIVHNIGTILRRIFLNERLQIFEVPENQVLLNLLVNLLHFWICELIFQDTYLLQQVVDILEILFKSIVMCQKMKSPQAINSLMLASKMDSVSAQTRSRLIKLISYLTRGDFKNTYNPKAVLNGQVISLARETDAPQRQAAQQLRQQDNALRERGAVEQQPDSLDQFYRNTQSRIPLNQQQQQYLPNGQPAYQGQLAGQARQSAAQQYMPSFGNTDAVNNIRSQRPSSSNHTIFVQTKINPNNLVQFQVRGANPQQSQQALSSAAALSLQKTGTQFMQEAKRGSDGYVGGVYSSNPAGNSNDPNAFTTVNDNLMKDYVSLLDPTASRDMHIFAVQNLEPIAENIIHIIMDNPESYAKVLNLIEITLPTDPSLQQLKILDLLSKHLNPPRAEEGLRLKVVQRILKAFNFQPSQFQPILFNLMRKHLEVGGYQVDVPLVISLIESPYENLQNLGMQIFTVLSDPTRSRQNGNNDVVFENHVKMIIDLTLAREKTHQFVNHALQTLANMSLKDNLRPHIIHNKGIEILLAHLRNTQNLEGQRIAAKALLNLSVSSRDTKMRIVGELTDEIKLMHTSQLDSIVHGYIQTLLVSKDNNRDLPIF